MRAAVLVGVDRTESKLFPVCYLGVVAPGTAYGARTAAHFPSSLLPLPVLFYLVNDSPTDNQSCVTKPPHPHFRPPTPYIPLNAQYPSPRPTENKKAD